MLWRDPHSKAFLRACCVPRSLFITIGNHMTFHDRRPPTRRPRRANTLKDLPRLLGIAEPAHEESRRDRLLAKARRMSDTLPNARRNYFNIQVANLFLRAFGVTLIANDRVFHIWEDWPGAVGAAWLDEGVGVATGACGCRCRPRHRRSTGGRENESEGHCRRVEREGHSNCPREWRMVSRPGAARTREVVNGDSPHHQTRGHPRLREL